VSITINLVSIPVDDQTKALEFYTEKFGFEKRADVSQGDYRWLTVTAPEGNPDVELVLEPNANPASKSYHESLRKQGIPITAFFSNDLDADYERLVALGAMFTKELTEMPWGSSRSSMTPVATSSSCSK
jgi:uncharacterized glyoxalase superfamily protein PhnB